MLSLWLQAILPLKRRRQRRKQGSLKWMRLCQYTGGTVMKRCTLAATSTPAVESTCSNLTTPIHSGAPRVSTTESTTPDKPEYRQWEIQGVCVCANGDICEGSLCLCVWMIWKTTRGRQRDKTGASTSAKMLLLYVCVCVCVFSSFHLCYIPSSNLRKRSVRSCCEITSCLCCIHYLQAERICCWFVFDYSPSWAFRTIACAWPVET